MFKVGVYFESEGRFCECRISRCSKGGGDNSGREG